MFVEPQAHDLGLGVHPVDDPDGFRDLPLLVAVGDRVACAIVMSHDGYVPRPVPIQRDVQVRHEDVGIGAGLNEMSHQTCCGDRVEVPDAERGRQIVGDLPLGSTVHAREDRSELIDAPTLGANQGLPRWNLSVQWLMLRDMEVIINVGAVVTGMLTLVVGIFSLATLLFEDLV